MPHATRHTMRINLRGHTHMHASSDNDFITNPINTSLGLLFPRHIFDERCSYCPEPYLLYDKFLSPSSLMNSTPSISLTRFSGISEAVLDHSPMTSIHALMHVDSFWYDETRYYVRRMQRNLLCEYVDDVSAFLGIMRRTSSILAGSEVLRLALHGTDGPLLSPRDLNIYTSPLHCAAFVLYLRDIEGYYVSPIPPFDKPSFIDDSDNGIVEIKSLVHLAKRRRILVTCSASLSPEFCIAHAPSTADMNFMTADHLVMAYPSLTLNGVGFFNPTSQVHSTHRHLYAKKALAHGFLIQDFLNPTVSDTQIDYNNFERNLISTVQRYPSQTLNLVILRLMATITHRYSTSSLSRAATY